MDSDDITLVTAFLDIGRSTWTDEFARQPSFYVDSFMNYLNYPYKMVCYIDDKYIDQIIIYEILCVNIIIHIRSYNNALAI